MRSGYALPLLAVAICGPGCALVEDGCRNIALGIARPIEEHREWDRNRKWADEAWLQVCMTEGVWNRSEDYVAGFKDGFAELLFRGGDGEPPLVAPIRYRKLDYQTSQGYMAVEDWFRGYRHGAAVARTSGARRWVTGPSSLQVSGDVHPTGPVPPFAHFREPIGLPSPEIVPAPAAQVGAPESAMEVVDPQRSGPAPPEAPALSFGLPVPGPTQTGAGPDADGQPTAPVVVPIGASRFGLPTSAPDPAAGTGPPQPMGEPRD
jgi:hypothetical protein